VLPFFKPVEDWTAADLRRLVQEGVEEDEDLEFKRDFYPRGDDGKRELLRDVAAMANQRGGFIVIGIGQEAERGVAKELVGIPNEAEERLEGWVRDVIFSGLDPRLPQTAARVRRIPISEGQDSPVAVVIQVPRSLAGPVMVRYQGRSEFWIRHGAQKMPMTWHEVRAMFEWSLTEQATVGHYARERAGEAHQMWKAAMERKFKNNSTGYRLFLLSATPIPLMPWLVNTGNRSLQNFFAKPETAPPWGLKLWPEIMLSRRTPTLEGVRIGELTDWAWAEVYRDGHVFVGFTVSLVQAEPQWTRSQREETYIPAVALPLAWEFFIRTISRLWQELIGQTAAIYLNASVFEARGLCLGWKNQLGFVWTSLPFESPSRPHIQVGDVLHYLSDQQEWRHATKRIMDVLWNAFGEEECPWFDAEGNPVQR
jgi:hypothetical protein